MITKGLLYVVLIILGGSFMLLSLIIALVTYSGNKKGAGKWLIGFFVGLAVLTSSVFLLTQGVISKTREFTEDLAEMGYKQMEVFDSLHHFDQLKEDSLLQSKQISAIIAMEPIIFKGKVPSRFYTYLGFRDYYRLPLRYPYSLHCSDSLGCGDLYNEENVVQFDVNDNGESFCDVNNIKTFSFSKDFLIGSRIKMQIERSTTIYFAYDLNKREEKEFKNEDALLKFAAANGFEKNIEFFNCRNYYDSF